MGNCTAVIQKVNSLCNIQEIASVGAELQKNLNKMGVVSELVEDAMESMDDDGDMDDDVVNFLQAKINLLGRKHYPRRNSRKSSPESLQKRHSSIAARGRG
jgi:hypothetical protein